MTAYLRITELVRGIIAFLRGGGAATEIEQLVGSWCLATQDLDKQVSLIARKAWDSLFLPWAAKPAAQEWDDTMQPFDDTIVQPLFEFVNRSVYDPQGVFLELNPIQPTYVPPVHGHRGKNQHPQVQEEDTSLRSKAEDEEESDEDRNARIRTGGLGVIRWFLGEPHLVSHTVRTPTKFLCRCRV